MDILNALREEKRLLLEMLDTLEEEKTALINNDTEKIQKALKNKEDLKSRIDDIEKVRIDKYGTQRLKEILPGLGSSEKEEAEKLGSDMAEIVYKIQQTNETNRMLIKQSLSYVKLLMNILLPQKVTVYGQTGQVQGGAQNTSILNKSV